MSQSMTDTLGDLIAAIADATIEYDAAMAVLSDAENVDRNLLLARDSANNAISAFVNECRKAEFVKRAQGQQAT